jgi:hypothetical protein
MAETQIDQAALLARWKKTRSPRLADLLCCVPVDDKWTAKLTKISRLITDSALRPIKNLPDDDPRVTVFLVQMLQKARWPGSSAKSLWKAVFKKLVALKDKRAVAPLEAMVATPPYFLGAGFTTWCVEQIKATADTLAAMKQTPDDAETKRLAAAQVGTVPPHGWFHVEGKSSPAADVLVAKVFAAPEDLELRTVIGDALLELGDPWGELIALQSTAKQAHSPAAKKLIHKHGARFVGAIAKVAPRPAMRFVRGFLDYCQVGKELVGRRLWEEAIKAPQWGTVKTVEFAIWGETPKWWYKAWLADAPLIALREIVVGGARLARTSRTAPWTFAKMPKRVEWRVENTLEGLFKGLRVDNLRGLALTASLPSGVRSALEDAIEEVS